MAASVVKTALHRRQCSEARVMASHAASSPGGTGTAAGPCRPMRRTTRRKSDGSMCRACACAHVGGVDWWGVCALACMWRVARGIVAVGVGEGHLPLREVLIMNGMIRGAAWVAEGCTGGPSTLTGGTPPTRARTRARMRAQAHLTALCVIACMSMQGGAVGAHARDPSGQAGGRGFPEQQCLARNGSGHLQRITRNGALLQGPGRPAPLHLSAGPSNIHKNTSDLHGV